jgi:hypothetical protein
VGYGFWTDVPILRKYMFDQGHIASSKNKKVTGLPLVLVAPLDEETGLSVVVGIPPYNDKSRY